MSETLLLHFQFSVGACKRPDLPGAIASTFAHGFQNSLAQMYSLRRSSAM